MVEILNLNISEYNFYQKQIIMYAYFDHFNKEKAVIYGGFSVDGSIKNSVLFGGATKFCYMAQL